jgi:branched-chain amino acid transport system substrate-binding protein
MNKVFKVLVLATILTLASGALAGCGGGRAPKAPETAPKAAEPSKAPEIPATIKLAMAAPLTGDYANFGLSDIEGMQLAVDEINAKGGVLGKKIELIRGDDKGDSKEAVSVAQKFVNDKDLVAVLGHFFSGCSLAAGPIYQKAGIPMLAVASTNPKVPLTGDYVFRINVGDNYQGSQLAEWLYTKKGKKSIAVVYDNNDYGKGVYDAFRGKLEQLGGKIVDTETYVGGQDKDFSVIITKAKQAKPEALVIAGYYSDAALLVTQAKRLGLDVMTVGSDSIYSDDFTKIGGKAVEGVYTVGYFHASDPRPKAQEFVRKYKEKYNKVPDAWAPYAYDAVYVIADAITRAGSVDRGKVRNALAQTKGFEGASGVTTFNENREPAGKDLIVLKVKDGSFVVAD